MAVLEDIPLSDFVVTLGQLGLWIQAVGLVVVLWIIFQAVTMFYNRKRRHLLRDINDRLHRMETQMNRIEHAVVRKKR